MSAYKVSSNNWIIGYLHKKQIPVESANYQLKYLELTINHNCFSTLSYNSATSKCVMSHQNQQMKEDNKQKNFLDHSMLRQV